MRRARLLLTSALVLSLPFSTTVPAAAAPQPSTQMRVNAAPAAPTAVQTFPVLGGIGIAWSAPLDAGGTVEGYVVQSQRSNGAWADASKTLPAGTTSWVDTHVKTSASATYRVIAVNADGAGEPSAVVTGTRPATDPAVGTGNVLALDTDVAAQPQDLFTDEVADSVVESSAGGLRTLSAGGLQIAGPRIFSGPGTYSLGSAGSSFVLRQKDQECSVDGTLNIAEIAYTADLKVATMSATYSGSCPGVGSVYGEIRVHSTQSYAALSIDTPRVDLGRVELNTAPRTVRVTLTNVGTKELDPRIEPLPTDPTWTRNEDFACQQLAPGASCSVAVTFAPDYPRDESVLLTIDDNTARATHHLRFGASVYTVPDAPDKVTVAATFSGVDLSWRANSWGNATPVGFVVERTVDGIATRFTVPPERTNWTERRTGTSRPVTYRVSAVNEFFESQSSVRVSPAPVNQQVAAFVAPMSGGDSVLGSIAVPKSSQIVPVDNAPAGAGAQVASGPNGVDLAYVLPSGLWIRQHGTDTLVRPGAGIAHPAWSPDGTRIAFGTAGSDSAKCVDVLTLSDSSVVRIGCNLDHPIWYTDNHSLIVNDTSLTGSPLTRVEAAEQGARITTIEGSEGATHAVLSPRGNLLAYVPEGTLGQVAFLSPEGGSATVADFGFAQGTSIAGLAWDTVGNQLGVLVRNEGRDILEPFKASDFLGGAPLEFGVPLYNTTTDRISDFTWQGHSVVIDDTPTAMGPDVSIPFDTSALNGEITQCVLDGEFLGTCTSPFTASGLSSGSHVLQIQTTNQGAYYANATRTFTVR